MKKKLLLILTFLFLPIFLLKDVVKSDRSAGKKISFIILILIFFALLWISFYVQLFSFVKLASYEAGVSDKLTKITVSGTSMLPNIKDGETIDLQSPKKYGLERGDIVSFMNNETGGNYYLKRIVGLGGERIYIKNGYVYINDKVMVEDYVLNGLPTFGNTFLIDCESYMVPNDHFAVLGDNRTVSTDSRVLGFVHKDDIEGVIKTQTKEKFVSLAEAKQFTDSFVDPLLLLEKINNKRMEKGVPPLITHAELNRIAAMRSEQISENLESWKTSTGSYEKFLENNNYHFNLAYELVTFGYLTEEDITGQILNSYQHSDKFMSSKYHEVGVGVSMKAFKECRFPVISVILSWPSIPTYDQAVVDSWSEQILLTDKFMSDMQTWIGAPGMDQEKLRRTITLSAQANEIATKIQNKVKNREWLTENDYREIKLYDDLVKEIDNTAKEMFENKVRGTSVEVSTNDRRI